MFGIKMKHLKEKVLQIEVERCESGCDFSQYFQQADVVLPLITE